MSVVVHQFGHVKFQIFELIFSTVLVCGILGCAIGSLGPLRKFIEYGIAVLQLPVIPYT